MICRRCIRALAGLLLVLTHSVQARNAKLPFSHSFLHNQCTGHRAIYEPLIEHQLARYRIGESLSVTELLSLEGYKNTKHPQILLVNGEVSTKVAPYGNMQTYWVPLLRKLAGRALLPDMLLASNTWDLPEDDIARHGGPWLGYCNIHSQSTNLLLPARDPVTTRLRCEPNCEPFTNLDKREAKAVFLGSSTGWPSGHRHAAVVAGELYNQSVYSGYTRLIDLPPNVKDKAGLSRFLKPKMSLAEQVKRFKYVLNADGHCAALRLRQLLASDSVVLYIESDQVEWFHPLLVPFVHYIPIRYDAHHAQDNPLPDLEERILWAEANPASVASIIHNANQFASTHLSEHAIFCYSFQLLEEYAHLFNDTMVLRDTAIRKQFTYKHKPV